MSAHLDNLRAVPPADVRSIDIVREDEDMCERIRRSVTADDVLNQLYDHLDTLDALLKADKPCVRLLGGLVLAVRDDYVARLIARERGLS